MAVRDDVALLHRRFGFGARPAELDSAAANGYDGAVKALLASLSAPTPRADAVPRPTLTSSVQATADRKAAAAAGGTKPGAVVRRNLQGETAQLVRWWVGRMSATEAPAQERLLWFWHGHFATSVQKVQVPALVADQLDAERAASTGPFAALLTAAVRNPAMLIWLDQVHSTSAKPNENLARETLELFSLGRQGGYTEDDVKAAARALTGWTIDPATGGFVVRSRIHDSSGVTVLGQTGPLDGDGLLAMAAAHPSTSHHIAQRAWSAFAAPVTLDDPVVADIAAAWDSAGRRGDALVEAIVSHPRFVMPEAVDAIVASPVDWMVTTLRALDLRIADDNVAKTVAEGLKAMGQVPFAPPSVGGWPSGAAWLNTGAEATKLQIARRLAGLADLSWLKDLAPAGRPIALAQRLGRPAFSDQTTAGLAAIASDPVGLVTLALVCPEALLR